MSEVNRICPQCGGSVSLQSRYCGVCGYDSSSGLPVQRNTLPATVGKAALPVVAGLAGLALRTGWKLLQGRLAQLAVRPPEVPLRAVDTTPAQSIQPARSPRRTIRIRSSWAVGDANGVWRQGQEEHVIEIDD